MSLTLTFTGEKSVLETNFFPPIYLGKDEKWTCSMLNFESFNSIPNVDETNNLIHVLDRWLTIEVNKAVDLHALIELIRQKFAGVDSKPTIVVGSFAGGKCKFKCSVPIFNFTSDSILLDLGFDESRKIFEPNVEHYSDYPIARQLRKTKLCLGRIFNIPKGSYELDDITRYLKPKGVEVVPLRNQLKCKVRTNKDTHIFLLSGHRSIGSLLGFTKFTEISSNSEVTSDSIVDIFKVNAIAVECSIISGSWKNGQPSHIIHQFFPNVAPGFKIIEAPKNLIYLDLITNTLDTITLRIVDQDGRLVDFRGETITVRLHLKRDD